MRVQHFRMCYAAFQKDEEKISKNICLEMQRYPSLCFFLNYPGKGTDTKVSSSQYFLIVKYYDSLKYQKHLLNVCMCFTKR